MIGKLWQKLGVTQTSAAAFYLSLYLHYERY